jgi:tRNA threonylcarbamoyladenosine biosynthesis protein TsaE
MRKKLITRSEDETIQAGSDFAKELDPGGVVACIGNLGTGKTRFIKGLCKGLGVTEHVASPTFTIVNEYRSKTAKIFHFDFYRLTSPSELREIGFEDYFQEKSICIIEWADKIYDFLPKKRIEIRFDFGAAQNEREIVIEHYKEQAG